MHLRGTNSVDRSVVSSSASHLPSDFETTSGLYLFTLDEPPKCNSRYLKNQFRRVAKIAFGPASRGLAKTAFEFVP
jgi:hypothetical protein